MSNPPPQSSHRVAYWDNARGILIFLVAFGHFIESIIWESAQLNAVYLVIYSFHMPVFVFIAGLMTRDESSVSQLQKNIASLLVPYLVFETLYSVWEHWTMGTPELIFSYGTPFYTLWFLVSLFCWRVMLPYLKQLRWGFLWTILASVGFCASNEVSGPAWSWARTLYFLPFFYAGHYARGSSRFMNLLTAPKMRVLGGAVMLTGSALMLFEVFTARREWLWGFLTTHQLGYAKTFDFLRRLGVYAVSFLAGGAFLCLVPRRPLPLLTGWGSRSLAIYLFHSFFHFYVLGKKWHEPLQARSPTLRFFIAFGAAMAVALLVGSKWWSQLMQWLLRPPTQWLWTKRNPSVASEPS